VSERPYKKPFSHEQAMEIIENDSGTHFDPQLVDAFLNAADDFWVESAKA
jgi:putative two-component system response regulator